MARIDEHGERIPLTVADFNARRGTVTVVIQAVGKTTFEMMGLREGDFLLDFIGPLGLPSHIRKLEGTVVLVGGGLGVAPVYPQLREYKKLGNRTVSIVGFRNRDLVFWEDRFREQSDELIVTTDDGSYGRRGFVTHALADVLANEKNVREVVAIGPIPMMKACSETTRPFGIPTIVSLNSIMVDGTGMCGSCRVTVGGKMKFACVDGADFDGHLVNFDELSLRQKRFEREEKAALKRFRNESAKMAGMKRRGDVADGPAAGPSLCELPQPLAAGPEARLPKNIKTIPPERSPMPHQSPEERRHNFQEVALGLGLEGALHEAERCIRCKKPRCVPGCPVGIDIPGFISALARQDIQAFLPDPEERQRAARGVRARLPAGNPMRGHLRGGREVQTGGHRPAGAICGRSPPWGAAGTSRRRLRRKRARRPPSSAPGPPASPARANWRATASR